jgi:hypothetical protein
LEKSGMQISGEDNENLLMDMVLEKKTLKRHISKKRSFHQHIFYREILHYCKFQETSCNMCEGKTEKYCKFFTRNAGLL